MPLNFTYDPTTARYRDKNGRFLAASDVRKAVDSYIDNVKGDKATAMFEALRNGQINVKELQLQGERQIAIAHGAAASARLGGRSNMTPSDWGRVGSTVKGELQHWRDLMKEIAAGKPIDGHVKHSFRAYFAAAGFASDKHVDVLYKGKGFDTEIWRLNDGLRTCSAHSGRPSCSSIAGKKQPIGTGPPRGQRACFDNCGCNRTLENSVTGERIEGI